MTRIARLIAACLLAGTFAAPAAGQVYAQPYPYPQTYPQTYPGQQPYGYPGQYGYGNQSIIGSIIDGLIGNRYQVDDRQAIRQCAYAAVQRAESQYQPYFGGMPYAYQGYNGHVRVTQITDVQHRSNGRVRVRGLLDTARGGYSDGQYGDLGFRCDVDYRGSVYNLDLNRNDNWRY